MDIICKYTECMFWKYDIILNYSIIIGSLYIWSRKFEIDLLLIYTLATVFSISSSVLRRFQSLCCPLQKSSPSWSVSGKSWPLVSGSKKRQVKAPTSATTARIDRAQLLQLSACKYVSKMTSVYRMYVSKHI